MIVEIALRFQGCSLPG